MKHGPKILGLMTVLLPVTAFAASAPAPDAFVKEAIQGDNSEIMLGQIAQKKGDSKGVKTFGTMLVTDHRSAKKEMLDLAATLKVSAPAGAASEAEQEKQKLSGLSGQAFDKEFVSYMTDDHQKDIEKFQVEADAKNGPASELASKQLPTLRKHLQMAQSLQKGS